MFLTADGVNIRRGSKVYHPYAKNLGPYTVVDWYESEGQHLIDLESEDEKIPQVDAGYVFVALDPALKEFISIHLTRIRNHLASSGPYFGIDEAQRRRRGRDLQRRADLTALLIQETVEKFWEKR